MAFKFLLMISLVSFSSIYCEEVMTDIEISSEDLHQGPDGIYVDSISGLVHVGEMESEKDKVVIKSLIFEDRN